MADFYDEQGTWCRRATKKALLVVCADGEVWIPKSVIHDDSEVYEEGHAGKLVVKRWWAEQRGWI